MDFRVIGPGRAGSSLREALVERGWTCLGVLGRDDDPAPTARGVDLVILAVPDDAIGAVARAIEPGPAVIVHLSGAETLEVLAPHERRASVHPWSRCPTPTSGPAACWAERPSPSPATRRPAPSSRR